MTTHTKPSFPSDPISLTRLPVCPMPFQPGTARGPDGLRAMYVFGVEIPIVAQLDQDYQPIMGVSVLDCKVPTVTGGLDVGIDAMDRVSWWLLDVSYMDDSLGPSGQPPDFNYEIRAAIGQKSNRVATGTSNLVNYGDSGLIIQVSGVLCTEWEFWARLDPFQMGIVVGEKIRVRLGAVVDRNGGSLVSFDGTDTLGVVGILKGELGDG